MLICVEIVEIFVIIVEVFTVIVKSGGLESITSVAAFANVGYALEPVLTEPKCPVTAKI